MLQAHSTSHTGPLCSLCSCPPPLPPLCSLCSRAYPLKHLLEKGLQAALEGKGRRVFEAWIISDEAAVNLMKMGLLQPVSAGGRACAHCAVLALWPSCLWGMAHLASLSPPSHFFSLSAHNSFPLSPFPLVQLGV